MREAWGLDWSRGSRPRLLVFPFQSHPTLSSSLGSGLLGLPVSLPLLPPPPQVTSFLFGACCCSPCSSTEYLAGPGARTGAVAPLCVGAMRILANKTRCVGVVEGGTCVWRAGKGRAQRWTGPRGAGLETKPFPGTWLPEHPAKRGTVGILGPGRSRRQLVLGPSRQEGTGSLQRLLLLVPSSS